MEDPGLLILPTHRVLPGVRIGGELLHADSRIEVVELAEQNPEQIPEALAEFGSQAVAVCDAGQRTALMVRPVHANILEGSEPRHAEAWRALGLAFLHAYLLDRLIAPRL